MDSCIGFLQFCIFELYLWIYVFLIWIYGFVVLCIFGMDFRIYIFYLDF